MTERCFVVFGRPQAKQRPRMFRGRAYTPERTAAYETLIKASYLNAYPDDEPLTGDLVVTVRVFFSKRNHGDLDNYVKTLDGLNKVAWGDDKQIKQLHAFLIVDKTQTERMEIEIGRLEAV